MLFSDESRIFRAYVLRDGSSFIKRGVTEARQVMIANVFLHVFLQYDQNTKLFNG